MIDLKLTIPEHGVTLTGTLPDMPREQSDRILEQLSRGPRVVGEPLEVVPASESIFDYSRDTSKR